MKVINFKEQNCVFAEGQKEYLPLPSHKDEDGVITSCWKLSLVERFKVLLTGKIFTQVLTFNNPLQPMKLMVDNPLKEK